MPGSFVPGDRHWQIGMRLAPLERPPAAGPLPDPVDAPRVRID